MSVWASWPTDASSFRLSVGAARALSTKVLICPGFTLESATPGCRVCGNERQCSPAPMFRARNRSEEHTSELQSLMRISYAVFCLKKKKTNKNTQDDTSVLGLKTNTDHDIGHYTHS